MSGRTVSSRMGDKAPLQCTEAGRRLASDAWPYALVSGRCQERRHRVLLYGGSGGSAGVAMIGSGQTGQSGHLGVAIGLKGPSPIRRIR